MEIQTRTVTQGVTQGVGEIKILALSGSFDAYHAPQVRKWFEEATAEAPALVIVNFENVSFLDSIALSILVFGMKRARQVKGDVRLCNLQQPVRMIFELTRLDRVFEIYLSEADTIQAFTDREQNYA